MRVITGDVYFWNHAIDEGIDFGRSLGDDSPWIVSRPIHIQKVLYYAEFVMNYKTVITIDLNLIDCFRLLKKQGIITDLVFTMVKTADQSGYDCCYDGDDDEQPMPPTYTYTDYVVDADGRVDSKFWDNKCVDNSFLLKELL